jgi:AcrR family transcriptional regulator
VTTANAAPSLRERKKAMTRSALQGHALRLFLAKGYDAVTVEEIAAAAGVSHMTFFRYFPTKEDVVLTDEYDALIAERIRARPADEPPIEKVRHALLDGLELVYAAIRQIVLTRARLILRTPQLRARLWEQQRATERLIAVALTPSGELEHGEPTMRAKVVAAACLAAATVAVETWAGSDDGTRELPDLLDEVFTMLSDEMSHVHG